LLFFFSPFLFLHFSLVPNMFSLCSHQVLNMFLKFSKKRCLGTAGHRIGDFLFFISKAFLVFSTENGKNGKDGKKI
jgi:hypothetical protein